MIPLMMQEDYKPQGWRKSQLEVFRSVLPPRYTANISLCWQWA